MADNPYPFAQVYPNVDGLTGVSNVGAEAPVTLTKGIPGFMYYADALASEADGTVEIIAGNSQRNLIPLVTVTAVADGAGVAATEATITLDGGPADAAATITVTVAVDGGTDIVLTYDFEMSEHLGYIVQGTLAAIDADAALTAVANGNVISITPTTGDYITKLEVAIA
jgi:hypothetical protein